MCCLSHTTGKDIFLEFKKLIVSENIPVKELVDLATDGAPAMIGVEKGFIALCRKRQQYMKVCIIHQQSLCGKFLSMNYVMKTVVKVVNKMSACT